MTPKEMYEATMKAWRTDEKAYCYVLCYNSGKIKIHEGYLGVVDKYNKRRMFFDHDSFAWTLNNLSPYEGIVRGPSIWFREPNLIGAVEAFIKRGKNISEEYLRKSLSSIDTNIKIKTTYI